jgi:hypothetical protein
MPAKHSLSKTLAAAGLATLMCTPALALDTRKIELSIAAGDKTYHVTAEPLSSWQLASEGQISLDQKFDIQPDGTHGTIQVKLVPAPRQSAGQAQPVRLVAGPGQGIDRSGRTRVGRAHAASQPCASVLDGG